MSFRNIRDEGIQKVATAAERLLLLPPDGTVVEQLDTHTLYIYDQPSNAWIAVAGGGGGGGNAFGIIQADSGTSPTADTTTDTLNLISDNPTNYSFTGDALTDTITFSAPGLLPKSTFEDYNLVQKEPTGFPNRTDSTTSFSNTTRIFTIQPATTSFDVYIRGNKYTKTTSQTTTIPNLSGNHYIYFDINGNLQNTQTADPTLFTDNALVGIIYWNTDTSTQTYYGEERHGLVMDGATHSYLHTVFGARYLSGLGLIGFTIGSGSANADAQFTSDAGSLRDEDILLTPAAQSQIPILYRQGTLWRKKTADSYPVIYSGTAGYTGANGRLPYNLLSGGTWSLSEVPNNNFVLVHFFGTNDVNNPVVGIQGINTYTSISNARAGANTEIASLTGLPFAEFVPIGTVIFETSNSYSNTPKARVRQTDTGDNYVDFRGSSGITISPGSISLDLNDLTDVNITSPSNNQVLTYDSATNTWINATNGNGTVTSVGLSLPTEFTVTGSPVTSSGTLTATFANQNANLVFAGPSSGAAATPSFRSLTATDIPSLPYVSTTLTSGNILVGDVSNIAASVTMSGDATIDNTGLLTVANNAITNAKFRQSAALSVVGRSANSTGDVADISAATDFNILRRSGTTIGFGSIDLSQSGAVGTSRLNYSNLAQGSARSVLGVTGNATADIAAIQGTTDQVLRIDSAGTGLAFGQIATGGITDSAVTYAKIQNVANQRVLGRNTTGSGVVEETTASQVLDWIGSTQGQILYRGASGWSVLAPGTSGQLLQTNGTGADPSWVTASGTGGITSLNSQTGASQTFSNDTNVTITSASNVHTLGWSGTLSNARGGTGTGTYTTGDILYASATNTLSKLPIGSTGQVLTVSGGVPAWTAVSGTGTVTSVGLSLPSIFTVSGSPVTTSGTLTGTLANQTANTVFAGPSSGGAAAPTFRSLVASDIPSLPYVSTTLNSSQILVGNASNVATAVTMSGDATLSNTGVLSITANAVTDADLRQSAGLSVIGRSANTTGNVADITAGSDFNILRRSGTTLEFGSIDLSQSGAVGTSRLGYSNLAQGSARSVLGVTGNATADVASIQGTADQVLRVDSAGTALSFGQIATGGIANDAVTYAKIQNVTNQRILGRNSAGSGDVEETTTSQVLDWIGSTQGQILYRGASGWAVLSPGTSGQVLQTNGAAADPSWATVSTGGITSLNSQTGATQTFANDTNVTITSATNTHTLGWSGTLSNARGGTGTGTYATGDILYASATNTLSKLTIGSTGQVLTVSGGVPTWAAVSGTGTVTSVGLSLPSIFTVSGSPVTTSGTLTGTLANQTANTVFAGPSSGGAAAPTFRSLVASDIPSLPYISTTLNSGQIIVGNASNVATAVTMSSDATISNTGALTIANNAVTDAKFRQSAALSVVGRASNTSGNVADITASSDYEVFRRSGTSIGFGSIDLSQSAAVGSSRLGFTNLDQGSARSVLGVAGNATANFASIQGTTDQVLRVDSAGTALGFGQVATGGIANDAVTYAKIQNVTNQRVLGRNSAGSGDVEETTASQVLDWIGSTQGEILYRGASGWAVLAPGTSGQLLQTNGTGADPSWVTASGGGGITSLNSQTGASQTFSNDTNVTITSSSNVHTLGWSGTLSNARGGTGTGTYTTGDILYASATNTLSKLPIGTTGQVLTVSGGVPSWAAAGGGSVTAGTNIENNSGTVSALTKTISPTSLSAFQNNYAPTGWGTDVSVMRLTASNFIFLTGLSAGATNQLVELRNVGTVSIGLMTNSTDSTAANRFDFGDEDFIIFPGYSVRIVYDGTSSRWRRTDQYECWSVSPAFANHWSQDGFSPRPTTTTAYEFGTYVGNGTLTQIDPTSPTTYYQQGVLSLATTATVGTRHSWYSNDNISLAIRNASGKDASYFTIESSVMFPNLSTSTDRYYFQSGLFDSVTGNPVDAVMVTYRDDENSGAFILRAHNSSTTTDANTTITVAANTWYRVKVITYPDATARLFINGTLEATLTTGLPVDRNIGYGVSIRKIAGTLARSFLLDYIGGQSARGGRF